MRCRSGLQWMMVQNYNVIDCFYCLWHSNILMILLISTCIELIKLLHRSLFTQNQWTSQSSRATLVVTLPNSPWNQSSCRVLVIYLAQPNYFSPLEPEISSSKSQLLWHSSACTSCFFPQTHPWPAIEGHEFICRHTIDHCLPITVHTDPSL